MRVKGGVNFVNWCGVGWRGKVRGGGKEGEGMEDDMEMGGLGGDLGDGGVNGRVFGMGGYGVVVWGGVKIKG
jgi:hypothetical protein